MPRRPLVPQPLRRGPFRWLDVRDVVPEHAVRSSAVVRVARGAYVPVERVGDERARLAAVQLVLSDDSAFSHTTAATLLGAPLPPERGHRVHVTVPAQWQPPERKGMVGHQAVLPPDHVMSCDGLRVTVPARTFVDLAGTLGMADLVAVGDHLLGRGLCSSEDVADAVRWAAGRRGVRRARLASTLLDGRARSRPESLIRVWAHQAGLPAPEVNGWIEDRFGFPRYQGDLVYREARVIVEYDGGHHRDPDQFAADLRRRNDLQRWGWRLVHVEATMLRRPAEVVHLLRVALGVPG